jgi:hypothetical protein
MMFPDRDVLRLSASRLSGLHRLLDIGGGFVCR